MPLKILHPDDLTDQLAVLTGTRPGIIKFSPLLRELERQKVNHFLIHSGQHYSPDMDAIFFRDLQLRDPEYGLSETKFCNFHGEQTAEMLKGIERILLKERPWLFLVGGDCNTHLAGALAARKLGIQVGHVEAGLRSGDWRLPEEHNRVIIDHISEHLFVHNGSATETLKKEGVRGEMYEVGTTITDAVNQNLAIARSKSTILSRLQISPDRYFLVTCHREENVDYQERLRDVLAGLAELARIHHVPIIFPAHPRTRKRIDEFGFSTWVDSVAGLKVIEPLGYLDFLCLLSHARLFLTDSGGGQQESCILRVPCVTLRESFEWKETLAVGSATIAGITPQGIVAGAKRMLAVSRDWTNPFGAGSAALQIVEIVNQLKSSSISPAQRFSSGRGSTVQGT
jgi:UDP-N-acetylglucosamine 2-epimerase (non-hydrolysing)